MSTSPLIRQSISTPLGTMIGTASDSGVVLFSFVDSPYFERNISNLDRHLSPSISRDIIDGDHPFLKQLEHEIGEYFDGCRQDFEIPLHMVGSDFDLNVWRTLRQIPYGTTCSYAQEACLLGRTSAVRAVANANGRNPLSILVPCHRVIGSDGSITGYSSGIQRKIELLRIEGDIML